MAAVRKLVADYRAKHPNSFSNLQGIDMANTPVVCDPKKNNHPNCIATMNSALSRLYGTRTVLPGDLGTEAFKTIDKLKKKGLVATSANFVARFKKDPPLTYKQGEDDVELVGATPGEWVQSQIAAEEDGMHAFAISLINGYHSATIIAKKAGKNISVAWYDSNVSAQEVTAAEINRKVRSYAAGRFNWLVREEHKKEEKADPDARNDAKTTTFAKLNPPK